MKRKDSARIRLHTRLTRLHETYYLTLISMVQGVVTGFLGANLPSRVGFNVESILFITTFLMIVLMWNEYVMGVATLRWIPNLLDALIPFAFCISEIFLCNGIKTPVLWFLGAAIFGFVLFLAFLNMYGAARRYEINQGMMKRLGSLRFISLALCVLYSIISFMFFLIEQLWSNVLLPCLALFLIIAFCLRTWIYWNRVMAFAKSSSK